MAGIYIHIPFCKHKCNYCNFFSVASTKHRDAFTGALLREMEMRSDYLKNEVVNTLYFGGGTPSLLSVDEINSILKKAEELFNISPAPEITLEANPDDLTIEKTTEFKNYTPVNRFSIGVQSFFDDDLRYLDRVHGGNEARLAIENVQKAGFKNITIDLIYGIPGLTPEKWNKNLDLFFGYDIPHLSSYSLTVEPKTALLHQITNKKRAEVDEGLSIRHFEILQQRTKEKEFVHYEISNFAKEGYYSKHNSIYWLGDHYIGLGPSAHSFNGFSRQWNVASVKKYIEADMVDRIVEEKEVLTTNQLFNEYVMTSLRTSWGCDREHINNVFGKKHTEHFINGIKPFVDDKKVIQKGNLYILSDTGKLFADGIAAEIFM
jgi:oxygen-independent coproporphyrinogen-3 oxidase